MADSPLVLFDTNTGKRVAQAQVRGQDVLFPDGVDGWTDVLDCRHEPYDERPLDENCDFALHVHKKFILVTEEQASMEPPSH